MPLIVDLSGSTFGLWKVLKKTNKKVPSGAYLYKCLNTKNKMIAYKTCSYLKQFKRRNSQYSTNRGRPRKWIITKIPYTEKGVK